MLLIWMTCLSLLQHARLYLRPQCGTRYCSTWFLNHLNDNAQARLTHVLTLALYTPIFISSTCHISCARPPNPRQSPICTHNEILLKHIGTSGRFVCIRSRQSPEHFLARERQATAFKCMPQELQCKRHISTINNDLQPVSEGLGPESSYSAKTCLSGTQQYNNCHSARCRLSCCLGNNKAVPTFSPRGWPTAFSCFSLFVCTYLLLKLTLPSLMRHAKIMPSPSKLHTIQR